MGKGRILDSHTKMVLETTAFARSPCPDYTYRYIYIYIYMYKFFSVAPLSHSSYIVVLPSPAALALSCCSCPLLWLLPLVAAALAHPTSQQWLHATCAQRQMLRLRGVASLATACLLALEQRATPWVHGMSSWMHPRK